MPKLPHNILLLTTHLLLAGLLPGTFLCMLLQQPEIQQFYLARASVGLALVLLVWVGALLVQQLWQRRWIGAGALVLLLAVDGLALSGGMLLMASLFMAPGPN